MMRSIRKTNTRPELALRRALVAAGLRGYRIHYKAPGGSVDVAFTRWRVAVFVDGLFWHGHPSKWSPGRFPGYWDTKIQRNVDRDRAQERTLEAAGWAVVRAWEDEVGHDVGAVVSRVRNALKEAVDRS